MAILSHEEILKVRAAVIVARLGNSRNGLFAGIPPEFASTLPLAATPGEQVLADLDALNHAGTLGDGKVPLCIWLKNAVALVGGRRELAILATALRQVEGDLSSAAAAQKRDAGPAADGSPTFNISISNSTIGGFGAGAGVAVTGTVAMPASTATSSGAPAVQGTGATSAIPLTSTTTPAGELASVYLSYGDADLPFAERLFQALEAAGVSVFFRHEHAVPGAKVHRSARNNIREYDHVILLCSERSLPAASVASELDEMLAREFGEGASERIIPVLLDDFVRDGWTPRQPDIRQTVLDRVPLDMKGTDKDEQGHEG